ncbi:L10-interacting MYB domain-containing protein-like [Papaver somniferum]|uniref:L10-interacting MYB domain-containing protein-like n=1 Tax=Papaver somniferum TaxID=3469 RepID=UPI000E70280D|nr:L10-interacting MYB domain-containing protein-like [Papaver somniferum]
MNVDNTQNVEIKQEGSANWDPQSVDKFCDACIKEVETGHLPGTHFSKIGWDNLVIFFNKDAGKYYNKNQRKNKWDSLKADWNLWRALVEKETGLGWDPKLKTIAADKIWWEKKIKTYPNAKKFMKKGIDPPMLEKLDRMFLNITATGGNEYGDSSNESEEDTQSNAGHRSENNENKAKRRKTDKSKVVAEEKVGGTVKLSNQFERFLDTVNTRNVAMKESQGSTVAKAMELLESLPSVQPGAPLWLLATDLFKIRDNRDIFCSIKEAVHRIDWLQYEASKISNFRM